MAERPRLKHSPGPWSCDGAYIMDNNNHCLAVMGWRNANDNKHVVVAAPDMLKALRVAEESLIYAKGVMATIGYTGEGLKYAMQLTREAILKATKDEV